jgi:hypothetical protein
MEKLKEAKKALETIANRDYESAAKPTYSGSSAYDCAEQSNQYLSDCEEYAQSIANSLYDDFEDEEWDVLSES